MSTLVIDETTAFLGQQIRKCSIVQWSRAFVVCFQSLSSFQVGNNAGFDSLKFKDDCCVVVCIRYLHLPAEYGLINSVLFGKLHSRKGKKSQATL